MKITDDNNVNNDGSPIQLVTPTVPKVIPPNDPFADLSQLRLSQDFGASLGVQKALLTVPVRKPAKEWFIQVHPDPNYAIETAVLELKEDREIYLVHPDLWSSLSTESTFSPRLLTTAVNTLGVVFVWPVRLPGPDGKLDAWNRSALEAVSAGRGHWVRVQANMSLGAYEVWTSQSVKPAMWPDISFPNLLRTAFKGHYIDSVDHPVLKRLRGEL